MKKRNRRKPKISDKKLRGEWTEMVFLTRATELGLPVSKPWGESKSYDFVAVRVKSTIQEISEELKKGYSCSVRRGRTTYRKGSFDFLAAYVIYEDAWYIIPEEVILGMKWISLATNSDKATYEQYREAWHLLKDCVEPKNKGIDLQGCAEEFSAASAE